MIQSMKDLLVIYYGRNVIGYELNSFEPRRLLPVRFHRSRTRKRYYFESCVISLTVIVTLPVPRSLEFGLPSRLTWRHTPSNHSNRWSCLSVYQCVICRVRDAVPFRPVRSERCPSVVRAWSERGRFVTKNNQDKNPFNMNGDHQ